MTLWFWKMIFPVFPKKSLLKRFCFKKIVNRMNGRNRTELWNIICKYEKEGNTTFWWIALIRMEQISITFVEMWGIWKFVPKNSEFAEHLLNRLVEKAPSEEALNLLISKVEPGSQSEKIILTKLKVQKLKSKILSI